MNYFIEKSIFYFDIYKHRNLVIKALKLCLYVKRAVKGKYK